LESGQWALLLSIDGIDGLWSNRAEAARCAAVTPEYFDEARNSSRRMRIPMVIPDVTPQYEGISAARVPLMDQIRLPGIDNVPLTNCNLRGCGRLTHLEIPIHGRSTDLQQARNHCHTNLLGMERVNVMIALKRTT
jgi:hypothetical protein